MRKEIFVLFNGIILKIVLNSEFKLKVNKDSAGVNPSENLENFTIRFFSLPYTNVEVESVFSANSTIRNGLLLLSVNALLHIKTV